MHVRFSVALAVLLNVLLCRNGDANLSRGEGGTAGWTYRCPSGHYERHHVDRTARRCPRCGASLVLRDASEDPSSEPGG